MSIARPGKTDGDIFARPKTSRLIQWAWLRTWLDESLSIQRCLPFEMAGVSGHI